MGHATRSKVILSHLIESGHDVRVATSERAYDFIAGEWPDIVFRIEGFHLKYDQGTVRRFSSFTHFLKTAPESLKTNVKQFLRLHRDFTPDVVISDFESFAFSFAKLHHIPLLSVDNMQAINRCNLDLDVPEEEQDNYRLAKGFRSRLGR